MFISSRTPEGQPNYCPMCGLDLRIEPSDPAGDAPCPRCGVLLWFRPANVRVVKPAGASLRSESFGRLSDWEGPRQSVNEGSSKDVGWAKGHRRSTNRLSRFAFYGLIWIWSFFPLFGLLIAFNESVAASPGVVMVMVTTYFATGIALLLSLAIRYVSSRPGPKRTGQIPMYGGVWDQQLDG
jgi:hypothetical protein